MILHLDLTTGSQRLEPIPPELIKKYIGGRGINSALLYDLAPEGLDPMSPENPIIFGAGILTGMPGPSAARLTISGKSPETGLFGDSNIGGEFGTAFAATGIKHMVITGRASAPSYILIEQAETGPVVTIMDAAALWGMDTALTQDVLRGIHGDTVKTACIGVAGENLVRFACVMHGLKNAAGRTGMGCLMGTKNLKAVAVLSSGKVAPHDPERFKAITRDINARMREEFLIQELKRFGTSHLYNVINNNIEMGRTYNGLSTVMLDNGDMSPETLEENFYNGKRGCRSCPVACRHTYKLKDGPRAGLSGEGPEYGTFGNMGPVLGINSVEAILVLNDRLNRLGLDSSSAGNIIAWAIELYLSEIINDLDTSCLKLDWNAPEIVISLLDDIANRRGFGDTLADGMLGASKKFGPESLGCAIWVKNLPQSDPVDLRFMKAYALGVSTATRGADHLRSRCPWEAFEYDSNFLAGIYGGPVGQDPLGYDGKGRVVWWWESYLCAFDSLGLCKLLAFHCLPDPGVFDFKVFAELIEAGTGMKFTAEEVFMAGENTTTIERRFICREGISRRDDYPPQRYFELLQWQTGLDADTKKMKLDRESYDRMLDEYYVCHGWNVETGVPFT